MPANRHHARSTHPEITEADIKLLQPVFQAAKNAVTRSNWKLGDPVEELTGFISLLVIVEVMKMLKEAGVIKEEPVDGPDDCGFY